MPRTSIAVQTVPSHDGLASVTFSAADSANGMSFPNDGRTILLVRNTDAAGKTVTVKSVADMYKRLGDLAKTVAASTGFTAYNLLDPAAFNQSDGTVWVDFSAATGVTVAAIKLER